MRRLTLGQRCKKVVGSRIVRAFAAAAAMVSPLASAEQYECLIKPNQQVEIRTTVEGIIEKVNVDRGDRVATGQVLVQLESSAEQSATEIAKYKSQMQGRIASSRNRLDFATRKLDRFKNMGSYVSEQDRDEAEAEKLIAQSELQDAIENRELAKREYQHNLYLLNRRTLRSPFDGIVVDRLLNPGDLAEPDTGRQPILTLAQINPLRVEAVLPLQAYGKLRPGMTGKVQVEDFSGSYRATVRVVDQIVDAASGTFRVQLELPTNDDGAPPGGVHCQVAFPQLTAGRAEDAQSVTSAKRY